MSFVDERIVKMVFDNSDFGSKISSTIGSINQLNKATDEVANSSNGGLSLMGKAFEKTEMMATQAGFHIQDVWLKMSNVFEYQIARKIVDTAKKVANALTMEGVSDGFKEYELKMGSIQTIMAGTGESLATVNGYLEELNKYSDQTIYSFADMTNNIGKFTNAGVKLSDAVAAIKGIANEAAISGANANEASRAMYNFSQALSAGYVKLIDWKSIENANMATKGFKDTLLEVALACGNVKKDSNGMYKVLTKNAQGGVMKETISATKNFNDSLSYQWMTTDVLTRALKIYATNVNDLKDYEKQAYEAELKSMGMTAEQIKKFEELGIKATAAASEIKTFSMLMDTLKEAVGSGWAMTWQTIIGDFEQAKSLWTEVGKVVGGTIDNMSESRNKFLKEGLQTGWEKFTTIEGSSIPDASKYKETLLEVAVASGKITKEQADQIESTEDLVKSMHELGWVTRDILIESVDKYRDSIVALSAEEKKERGITDAQIAELQILNRKLKTNELNADKLAESMNNLGGRENIIEGLRNAFHALIEVLTPIRDAFREIFPAATADQLYDFTKRFKEFTEGLKATKETIDKIKRTAKGFFAIFKIAGRFISAFVKALLPASEGLSKLGSDFLTITAEIGDYISGVNDAIEKNKTFEKFFSKLSETINKVVEGIKNFSIEEFKEKVKSVLNTLLKLSPTNNKALTGIAKFFRRLGDDLVGAFENVKKRLAFFKPLVTGLISLFKGLVSIVGYVFQSIGETLSGVSSGGNGVLGLTNLFNAVLSGGILYKIFSGVKIFSKAGGLLESVGNAIDSFQKKIDSENLLNIGKAIALLAASLFIVAMIDEDKLLGATTAISAMVTVMAGAMGVLMKAISAFSTTDVEKTFSLFGKTVFGSKATKVLEMAITLQSLSKALIAMGAAILMMSIGLKIISNVAEGGHLWDSFVVLSIMLAELVAVSIVLGKFGNQGAKGAKNLTSLTTALVIMSGALAIVAKIVEGGNAWEALKIISIMLGELGLIAILIESFGKYKLGGMTGLITMSVSLLIVIAAVKKVSDALGEEGQKMWEALGFCGAILVGLAVIAGLLGKFGGGSIAGGLGAILAATALVIVVQAIKQINDMLSSMNNHVWQSLWVIATGLLILAAGLSAMSGSLLGAAGLLVASAALIVFAGALKLISMIKTSSLIKSLLAIGAALLILAVGLTAMIAALPGAAALVIAAAGLSILAGVLKILGSMKLKEIGKALLALVGTLTVIAVVGTLLSVAAPMILLFGAAIAVLGVGLLATGVGLTLFASGLQTLVAVLPLGVEALKTLAMILGELILKAIGLVFDALGLIAVKIVEYAPEITLALLALLTILLDVLISAVPQIADAALQIVVGILTVFAENIPEIAKAGADIIIAFVTAIGDEIPRIVDASFKCAIALINGLADAIDNNNEELLNAIDRLLGAVIDAIGQWLVKFTPLGWMMPDEIKEGVLSGEMSLWEGFKEMISDIIEKIGEKVKDFVDAGKKLIGGFIKGIFSKKKDATDAASELGSDTVDSLNSKEGLDEHSPSVKGFDSGENLYKGLINGMNKGEKEVKSSAMKLSSAIKQVLADTSDLAEDNMEIHPVISPVLDLSNVSNVGNLVGNLNPVASMSMASSISSLHDSRERQNEMNERNLMELNMNQQKIEKSINDMSDNVVKAITESDIPVNVNLTLQGDSAQIFKLVRQENSRFTKINGYNALAY